MSGSDFKTKNRNGSSSLRERSLGTLQRGCHIYEDVDNFKHLTINIPRDMEKEKINLGYRAYYRVKNVLQKERACKKTNIKIHKTITRKVLEWDPGSRKQKTQRSTEIMMVREGWGEPEEHWGYKTEDKGIRHAGLVKCNKKAEICISVTKGKLGLITTQPKELRGLLGSAKPPLRSAKTPSRSIVLLIIMFKLSIYNKRGKHKNACLTLHSHVSCTFHTLMIENTCLRPFLCLLFYI